MQPKINQTIKSIWIICALAVTSMLSCTKYETGFISPYFQYPLKEYSIIKGRLFTSDAINPDGSSIPFKVKLLHIYDAAGKVVDDIFLKTYPVKVWTAAYNPLTDTTVEQIESKRVIEQMPAIAINENNGAITANAASLNLPSGLYTVDLEITNTAGTKEFSNIVSFNLQDGPAYQTAPDLGSFQSRIFKVGNEAVNVILTAPSVKVQHVSESSNLIIVKFLDKNGVPFSGNEGAIQKRPNTGLNPTPPHLQNLQDYTHSYIPTDTSVNFAYALTPMPTVSLGNGFNMYYRIPTKFVHVDGYPDDTYSLNIRFPIRFFLAGTYVVTIRIPGVSHR